MGRYTGTSGADTITPTTVSAGVIADPSGSTPSDAADNIVGNGGGDYLDGGAGGDTISGGAGDDSILDNFSGNGKGPNSENVIHGDGGDDTILITVRDSGGVNSASNAAWGDDGNDNIQILYHGQDGEVDWLGKGPSGTIQLHGGAGDDGIVSLGAIGTRGLDLAGTTVFLYGDAGGDTLMATRNDPNDSGDEELPGNNPDYLYGGPGDDTYGVYETKDVAIEKYGEGHDRVFAQDTDYTLGPNIEDLILSTLFVKPPAEGFHGTGNALNNVIVGNLRTERLDGLAGNDTIYGGGGDGTRFIDADIIHGGVGNDLIYGGYGGVYEPEGSPDGADHLYGDAGNDRIYGQVGDDVLYGGAGNDSLAGQEDNDTLWGGTGNDHLGGGTGNDALYGEKGDDVIAGRYDADTLSGGGGNDRFVYEDIADSKPGAADHDTILDMAGIGVTGGDRVDLHQIDADATKGGNQAFVFVSPTATLKAGQLHVVAGGGTDSLVQGEVDGNAGVDFEILVNAIKPGDWTAGDFIL